jgi:hypothetical protein
MDRREFEALLTAKFPLARSRRTEHAWGWTDAVDLNFLRVLITYYEKGGKRIPQGSVLVEIFGVRTTTDHSDVCLWHTLGSDLEEALVLLQSHLLGMAAAILYISGNTDFSPTPTLGPPHNDKLFSR